jgi:hypothetical protein
MLETRIAKRREFQLKFIGGKLWKFMWVGQRKSGRELIESRGPANKLRTGLSQPCFELRQVGLGYTERA